MYNREREEIVLLRIGFFIEVNLIQLVEKLGAIFQSQYLNLVCDVFFLNV